MFMYDHLLFTMQGSMWQCQLIEGETGPTQIYMFKNYIDFEFFAILIYVVRLYHEQIFIYNFIVLCMDEKLSAVIVLS